MKVQNVLNKTQLPLIGINTHPGNLKKGFCGFSALAKYDDKAKSEIRRSIDYGFNVGIKNLHVMAGNIVQNQYSKKLFVITFVMHAN